MLNAQLGEHPLISPLRLKEKGVSLSEFLIGNPAFETSYNEKQALQVRLRAGPQQNSGLAPFGFSQPAAGAAPMSAEPAAPLRRSFLAPAAGPGPMGAAPMGAAPLAGAGPLPQELTLAQQSMERIARITKMFPARGFGFIESEQKYDDAYWNDYHFSFLAVMNKAPEDLAEGQQAKFTLAFDNVRSLKHGVPLYKAVNIIAL